MLLDYIAYVYHADIGGLYKHTRMIVTWENVGCIQIASAIVRDIPYSWDCKVHHCNTRHSSGVKNV